MRYVVFARRFTRYVYRMSLGGKRPLRVLHFRQANRTLCGAAPVAARVGEAKGVTLLRTCARAGCH